MSTKEVHPPARFGPFEADFREGVLRKHGRRIKIQAKPLSLLQILVSKPGEIVSREELRNALWPGDVYVDFDKNLATAINKLRTVLGDSADSPRYIETIPRRGYRFLAPVETVEPEAPAAAPAPPASVPPDSGGTETRPDDARAAEDKRRPGLPLAKHKIFWIGASVGGAAVIALIVLLAFRRRSGEVKLKQTDTILLANFRNLTGDPLFDNTLRQGLTSDLEQSPYLNLVSQARIGQTLAQMERPSDTYLSPAVARQVCQRTGSKAYVAGSISPLGDNYVLQLKAVNCENDDTLANEQAIASSKDQVVGALGTAATRLRQALGESLATLRKFNVPLAEATTSSLAALKAYSLGQKAAHEEGAAQSLPYDQRAIALDPNFAMAWEAAGVHYANLGEPSRAAEYLTKAFRLRDRASERERLRISAFYYLSVTGQLNKAAETYREMIADYPHDIAAYNNLGIVLAELGHYQQAVDVTQQGVRIAPGEITLQENLTDYLLALQQFDEARQIIREAQPKKPDNYIFPAARYVLAFLVSNSKAMSAQEQWFARKPTYKNFGLALAAGTAAYTGKLKLARTLTNEATRSAIQADARETGAMWQAIAGQWEAAYGFRAEGRRVANAALALDPKSEGTEAEAALGFALAGEAPRAESLARDLNKRFPLDTQIQGQWLPAVRAQLDLNRDNPTAALKELRVDSPPAEFGTVEFSANVSGSCLYPSYIRGEADLEAKKDLAAETEFQAILNRGGIVWNCWTGAMARLGLARAEALQARTSKGAVADAAGVRALDQYKNLLTLWKDADPGIPVLKQAKAEYAKLLSP